MQVRSEVGDVTVLVNNAGIVSGKTLDEVPDKLAELTFQVNTIAHFWVNSSACVSILNPPFLPTPPSRIDCCVCVTLCRPSRHFFPP